MSSVAFVIGTTAEIIKIAYVKAELELLGIRCEIWSTQQQAGELEGTLVTFFDSAYCRKLSNTEKSLETKRQVLLWALSNFQSILRIKRSKNMNVPDAFIAQGDTMSTVIGTIAGKLLSKPVVHIEAGLRSGDWKSPFPEELSRRFVGRMATLHLAPDTKSFNNLQNSPGHVVNTFGNTGIDALKVHILENSSVRRVSRETRPNVIVVLHRTELISRKGVFGATINLLDKLSLDFNVTLTLDAPSAKAYSELKKNRLTAGGSDLKVIPKLKFPLFVELLAETDFVITDSGGLQEECSRLGIPCFIHREVSERLDGIGENAVLTNMDVSKLEELVKNWRDLKRLQNWPEFSPSKICAQEVYGLLTK